MKKFNGVRHGEVMLIPFKGKLPEKVTIDKKTSYILAHSETQHHHVLEAQTDFEVIEDEKEQIFIRLFAPTQIVHKKQTDKHRTLTLPPSILKRYHDTEEDLWTGLIEKVRD